MKKKQALGFTLTELMVVVTITGIIAAAAAPSLVEMNKRHHLKTAAETIHADLQYAKTQAIKTDKTVHLSFKRTSNTVWCYGITDAAAACDCISSPTACTITENGTALQKVTQSSDFSNVQLETVPIKPFSFSPIRPTGLASGVTISIDSYTVRVKKSNFGKISYCVPNGKTFMGGYKPCL